MHVLSPWRESVVAKCVRAEDTSWDDGIVMQVVSQVTYLVRRSGQVRFVRADHLRPSFARLTPLLQYEPVSSAQPQESLTMPATESSCKDPTVFWGRNAPISPLRSTAHWTVATYTSGESRVATAR